MACISEKRSWKGMRLCHLHRAVLLPQLHEHIRLCIRLLNMVGKNCLSIAASTLNVYLVLALSMERRFATHSSSIDNVFSRVMVSSPSVIISTCRNIFDTKSSRLFGSYITGLCT